MVDVLLCRRHITPPPRPRDGFATIEDPKLIEGGQRSGPEAETETGSGSEEEEGMWRRRVEEEEEGLEASVWVSEGRAHAALQLFSLTAADAVGTELPEDTDFLAPLLPHVPVRPLRYIRGSHYDYAPLCNAGEGPLPASTGSTAEFVGRRGMLFMGSAHSINVESVVFLMDEILPRLLARGVAAEDLVLHVIGPNMNHQQHILEHRMQRHLRLYGRVRGPEQEALMQGVKVFVSPAVSGPASFKTKNLEVTLHSDSHSRQPALQAVVTHMFLGAGVGRNRTSSWAVGLVRVGWRFHGRCEHVRTCRGSSALTLRALSACRRWRAVFPW
jgi:hypothetical protein